MGSQESTTSSPARRARKRMSSGWNRGRREERLRSQRRFDLLLLLELQWVRERVREVRGGPFPSRSACQSHLTRRKVESEHARPVLFTSKSQKPVVRNPSSVFRFPSPSSLVMRGVKTRTRNKPRLGRRNRSRPLLLLCPFLYVSPTKQRCPRMGQPNRPHKRRNPPDKSLF